MRERDLALFIAHREIIAATVFEIADAGDPYAVAVDECSWHHCNFRPPGPVVGRFDTAEPNQHAEKECGKDRDGPPGTRVPESPDADRQKNQCHRYAHTFPGQVVVTRQAAPCEEQD